MLHGIVPYPDYHLVRDTSKEYVMNRFVFPPAVIILLLILGLACAGSSVNPVTPDSMPNQVTESQPFAGDTSGPYLWGYYDISIDIENEEITAVPNRNIMFALNVVHFLNSQPEKLAFSFNGTNTGPGYVDVDLDVSITHPIPDKPKLNGYDVRGIFIGYGTGSLKYDWNLRYAEHGMDQSMMDDPVNLDGGGPDGYTRWYNMREFLVPGLFGYVKGVYATELGLGVAILNPYKYFADDLGPQDDLWEFLSANPDSSGVFSSGATNTRNYYIRFPIPHPGTKYAYAVVANWENGLTHPANATEPIGCRPDVIPNLYYENSGSWGGMLKAEIDVWSWEYQPSTLTIESNILFLPCEYDLSVLPPIGGGEHYSTYYIEIPATNIISTGGNEFWVILEQSAYDYTCDLTPPAGAPDAPLAAFFRYDLYVHYESYWSEPICDVKTATPMPYTGSGAVEFDASDSFDPGGEPLEYQWDFDGDGIYDESVDDSYTGSAEHPTHTYTQEYIGQVWLKVVGPGGEAECFVEIDVTIFAGITLYLYDGTVDDGGIVNWTGGSMDGTWEYCPGINAWDEDNCGPYGASTHSLAMTPLMQFPEPGHYESIHLEIWHWGDMQGDGKCFGSLGTLTDLGGGNFGYIGNFYSEELVYIEGFDFNDIGWDEWTFNFGTEGNPEWSHFTCDAYEAQEYAIGMEFSEWGVGNPNTQEGWNIRKLWVYYYPS